MKQIKKFLNTFDGLWALPAAFLLFVIVGYCLQEYGGLGTGDYDIAFIQPLFLASAVVIGATSAAVWGLYFVFRDFHKYLYGNEGRSQFKDLKPLYKCIITLVVFFLFLNYIIQIYLKLV